MKTKNFVIFSLLCALSFSIVHEYVFTFYDNDHCNVSEYVAELDNSQHHGDICDIHFEYHLAYLLPSATISLQKIEKISELELQKESYTQKITQDLIIPPSV